MDIRRFFSVLLLAALVLYSVVAVARVTQAALQDDNAVGWDPACADDSPSYIGPVVFGYCIGAFVGVLGIGRRRLAALNVRSSVLQLD